MSGDPTRVLLADRPGQWCDTLASALETQQVTVQSTCSGEEVLKALTETSQPLSGVIIGTELQGLSGLDALYQASQEAQRAALRVFLVTEVRADVELRELLRSRGVSKFLYREDPIEKTLAPILFELFADRRTSRRVDVSISVHLEVRGHTVPATINDLSSGGARVTLSSRKLPETPRIGDPVELRLTLNAQQVHLRAELRSLAAKEAIWGDRYLLGLQFLSEDDSTRKLIERLIHSEEQMAAAQDEALSTLRTWY